MQATSRESMQTVRAAFDELCRGLDDAALRTLADELSAVTALLSTERVLRRHLADSSTPEQDRRALVDGLFSAKVGANTLEVLRKVATAAWSRSLDLLDAVELFARLPLLVAAEQAGNADEVEDELFRFGRILEAQPRLDGLLADESAPYDGREQLLGRLLEGKAHASTVELLKQVIRAPRGRRLDLVVEELAELAAARRDESIAYVTAAADLTSTQEQRLATVLSRIYGRRVSVRVEIDPEVLGGLVVRVGNEVIDGSMISRLEKARRELLG